MTLLHAGDAVRVVAMEGLTLIVEPVVSLERSRRMGCGRGNPAGVGSGPRSSWSSIITGDVHSHCAPVRAAGGVSAGELQSVRDPGLAS